MIGKGMFYENILSVLVEGVLEIMIYSLLNAKTY